MPTEWLPRERLFMEGEEALADPDLLALILGIQGRHRDARKAAADLLQQAGGLRALSRRGMGEMMAVNGIGPARAARLAAFFALARRLETSPLRRGMRVRCSRDVYEHFSSQCRDLEKEVFLVLLLDTKHRVIREERISVGSLSASIVHPREVFQPAIRESAGAIVAVHNHPSGDPTPSREDYEITVRLKDVGDLVGIHLLDHIVLGEGTFVSFREDRLVQW